MISIGWVNCLMQQDMLSDDRSSTPSQISFFRNKLNLARTAQLTKSSPTYQIQPNLPHSLIGNQFNTADWTDIL